MELEITPTDDGFRLEGELDMVSADELRDLLQAAAADGGPIVLDFAGISFMDSSGLRALLEVAEQLARPGSVVILHPTDQVRRLLEISIPGGSGLEVRG